MFLSEKRQRQFKSMHRVSVREEIMEGWRKRNEEPDNLYFLSDIRMKK
jgi:hypothetical protein